MSYLEWRFPRLQGIHASLDPSQYNFRDALVLDGVDPQTGLDHQTLAIWHVEAVFLSPLDVGVGDEREVVGRVDHCGVNQKISPSRSTTEWRT